MTKINRRLSRRAQRQTLSEEEVQAIFKKAGGAKNVSEQLAEFRRNDDFFASNWKDLLAQYPDQYVAVFEEKVVDHAKSRSVLKKRLRRRGFDTTRVVIQFLDTKPRTLILLEAA